MIVLSDIHANLPALEAVLADAPDQTIFFCGDLLGYYPWPNQVADIAQNRFNAGVRGNHDEAIITDSTFGFRGASQEALAWQMKQLTTETRSYLTQLPYTRRQTVSGKDVFLVHGSPNAPVEEYIYPADVTSEFLARQQLKTDILLIGHTHVPFTKTVENTLIVNPGSVGQPRDGNPAASYAVIDPDNRTADIRRVSYNIDRVVDRITDEGLPEELGARLRQGR